jgi:hypothetical protein
MANSVAPEPAGSSPYSQQPTTGPYPEPTAPILHPQPIFLRSILIPSTPWSSEWSISFGLSHQNSFLSSPIGNRGSLVSIVSACGLDDRAMKVRYPAGAEDFSSSLCVQTGSGTHPAFCTMGTEGPFPGGNALPGRNADHSPHLVPRS